jgi:hypothetical protein
MLRNHGVNLKQLYASEGAESTCDKLKTALVDGDLKPEDFSFREIAEAFCGHEWVRKLHPRYAGDQLILAGEDAVDVTAFSNITGQIVYSKVMQGYKEADAGLFDRLCTTIPTEFSGEKIPGVQRVKDEEYEVHPGKEYPETGFGEDYQETPATTKRGEMIKILKETVFFDRTGLVLRNCNTIGARQATGRLKRLLKVVIGSINNYKWRGTSYNTYLTTGNWINKIASHTLADYTDLEDLELLWANMTDPDTGNPIDLAATLEILCCPQLKYTFRRILHSTDIQFGDTTQGTTPVQRSANPLQGWQDPIVSRFLYQLLQSELSFSSGDSGGTFIGGDFKQAFWYMENWPITVIQAPQNNPEEFTRDVVAAWRCSEMGVAAVGNPRYVIFSQPQA